jgi:putative ABC transport system permease protein
MNLFVAIQTGLREIGSHKFRSALSMLGIILGVSSLIATMALTRGMEVGTRTFMQQLGGLELVRVTPKEPSADMFDFAVLSPGRTLRDAEEILANAPLISHVSPELKMRATVSREDGGEPERWAVNGVMPGYFVIGMHSLVAGRFLTDLDSANGSRCVVIGSTVASDMWPGVSLEDIPGRHVLIDGSPFEVVGVLEHYEREGDKRARKAGRKVFSRRWDPFRSKNQAVLIPFSTMFHEFLSGKFPEDSMHTMKLDDLTVRVGDLSRFPAALEQVRAVLHQTHRGVDDFELDTREDWFDSVESNMRAARLSGGLISAISLVVGAIGIMNIMLASISERIREIGIRLAVGARPGDIFLQILVESVLVSAIGGVLGIGASLGLVEVLKSISPTENVPIITAGGVVFSVIFALVAGLLSGIYPGLKASRLNPINALRYE